MEKDNRPIAISVKNVSKDFMLPHQRPNSVKSIFTGFHGRRTIESQHALNDISFDIKQGEFFGIVGRNGSGKSTLLKILANIYQPTEGSVQTHGKLIPFIELGVGFNPELTGRENVYLNGAMLGFSEAEVDAIYDDIVAFAELERFMDQKLKNYSSGMQVRLAFSVATRAKADILLVDEVLAVGDADFQRKCFNYFRELKRNKKTVVFVSHDMNAVREYCDRAILVEKSQLVKAGSSDEIATAYSRMFIDEPAASVSSSDKAGRRWGSNEVHFTDVRVSHVRLTDKEKTQHLHLKVRADEDVEDVVVGFYIKNPIGTPIVGTNNQIVKRQIKRIAKGEELEFVWTIPNIFSEGRHVATIALEASSKVCDWWEDGLSFDVFLERNTSYTTSPEITFTSSHKEVS